MDCRDRSDEFECLTPSKTLFFGHFHAVAPSVYAARTNLNNRVRLNSLLIFFDALTKITNCMPCLARWACDACFGFVSLRSDEPMDLR